MNRKKFNRLMERIFSDLNRRHRTALNDDMMHAYKDAMDDINDRIKEAAIENDWVCEPSARRCVPIECCRPSRDD